MRQGKYDAAADGMLASAWATQVKGRAIRLADMMRKGV
jgi:lysozyme